MNTTFAFDFDHTLAATDCKVFGDYADPTFVDEAYPLPLVEFAANMSQKATVKILTARSTENGIGDAIERFCDQHGIMNVEIIGVADLFKSIKVKGKRKARKLRTAEKKALILARWASKGTVCFWDDCDKNIAEADKVDGVITTKVG